MLVAALTASLLAGCGKNKKTEVDNTEPQSVVVSTDTEEYKAVEEYLKDTNATFEMYDINLLDKSKNKVQPNGEVEVSVK